MIQSRWMDPNRMRIKRSTKPQHPSDAKRAKNISGKLQTDMEVCLPWRGVSHAT